MNATPAVTPELRNATSLAAQTIPFVLGRQAGTSLIAKGAWSVRPGALPEPIDPSPEMTAEDLHTGDPLTSACRYESDLVPFKPKTDCLCVGNAYPAKGKPGPNCIVAFGVGSFLKQILVIGKRTWQASGGGKWNTPTPPQPFVSLPVSFDHAFGGRDPADPDKHRFFAANPVGKGYASVETALGGLELPNLEDPANPMRGPKDQPAPRSFGPVGRTWTPRLALAGTYDKRWLDAGAPVPPDDFNEAFYNCAPLDQQIQGYLRGDETVRVKNMHPVHSELAFPLPGIRVRCLADRERNGQRRLEDLPTNLDTLWLDMEALKLVLVWRARLPLAAAEGVGHLLVVSEPLGGQPVPPESYRRHIDEAEAAEADPEEPEIEPADVAQPLPESEEVTGG